MDDMWTRFASDMVARVSEADAIQTRASTGHGGIFAIRSGLADAKGGRPPFFWSLVSGSAPREALLESGWKSVGRVFILAVVLDVVYQLYVLRFVYPIQAFVVAFILAIVPYVILRGLVTRLARTNRVRG
jgi:hypothetical protein